MQDNELDDLFRSKLENFEVTPSAGVWNNIAGRLDNRRRRILPYLNIAASILILAGAGVLFFGKYHVQPVKHAGKEIIAHHAVPPAESKPVEKHNASIPARATALRPVYTSITRQTTLHNKAAAPKIAVASKVNTLANVQQPAIDSKQPPPELAAKAVVPDISFAPAAKQADVTGSEFAPKQPVFAADFPENKNNDGSPAAHRHKIHNIGDLINVMIAKVDKRKDKIIQFTDNDDNEASLTGINLGFIKIKKEK